MSILISVIRLQLICALAVIGFLATPAFALAPSISIISPNQNAVLAPGTIGIKGITSSQRTVSRMDLYIAAEPFTQYYRYSIANNGTRFKSWSKSLTLRNAGKYSLVVAAYNNVGERGVSSRTFSIRAAPVTPPPTTPPAPPPTTEAPGACTMLGQTLACDAFLLINRERQARNLDPLSMNNQLAAAAANHNTWMITANCFSHVCPGEADMGTRISQTGYSWSSVGETIAAGYPTAQAVVSGWMNSPGHRDILMGNFKEIGLSVSPCSSGCTYGIYWTADVGTPR